MSKIIYLTAGAGGMFCGSCMHDNALTRALRNQGWDIQLFPTYQPIRTDEPDVSVDQILFGGINVYLQQKIPLLRYAPAFLDRFLDSPWLIKKVTSRAMETDPAMLGQLAVSMLMGKDGRLKKEVGKMCKWLKTVKPDLLVFSNILIGGCIETIKEETGIPVLVTLQGDDVFLDSLKEPYQSRCIHRIAEISKSVDGFLVHSEFFRDYMGEYFSIPTDNFHVTPLGLELSDFDSFRNRVHGQQQSMSVGYLARLAPEKGLQHLVDAFLELRKRPDTAHINLRVAGWLGPQHSKFAQQQFERLDAAGLKESYDYLGSVDREGKLDFLRSIDVLSVPTEFQEPKGLYVLEAIAAGVPVVQPSHGAFPELIQSSAGGLLVPPRDPQALAEAWMSLLQDGDRRTQLAHAGQQHCWESRSSSAMAASTSAVFRRYL